MQQGIKSEPTTNVRIFRFLELSLIAVISNSVKAYGAD
jgi:hypothetical protein